MAHHKKHEEHVNHERWLVSFADMMTLLFALFVVLYAMGRREPEKAIKLKNSIQWAFHIDGLGKTDDIGAFNETKGAGELPMPAPLLTAQNQGMKELLKQELTEEFKEVSGMSLEIDMTNDAITVKVPLSTFFEENKSVSLKTNAQNFLNTTVLGSLKFCSRVQFKIVAPQVMIGKDRSGRPYDNLTLIHDRLITLWRVATNLPEVDNDKVTTCHRAPLEVAGKPGGEAKAAGWEDRAILVIQFNNSKED